MPDYRSVLFVVGLLLIVLACAMAMPLAMDLAAGSGEWHAFGHSALISAFIGGCLALAGRDREFDLGLREAFLITTASWITISAFAALPFWLRGGMDFTDAFFESISGLTTTGSTVMTGLDTLPPGILLWRSLLQWLGGIGIIAMAIMILPFLRVGGMQLFRAESSERGEKVIPNPVRLAVYIGFVYVALTMACATGYALAGMSPFDAVNHAMTTLSTGGYSTHDASLGHFREPAMHWIGTVFMASGAMPFVLYIKGIKGNWGALWRDQQVRGFVGLLVTATLILAGWLWLNGTSSAFDALRHAAFNVTSIVTTTGYASADYGAWGAFPTGAFLLLTFLGGCTGSTSGAIKVFRHQVMLLMAHEQIRQLVFPRAVFARRYNGQRLPDEIIPSVMAFIAAFFVATGTLTLGLAACGLDIVTAFSGAATAISNVGPGLGPTIGPAGNFASLPDVAKWILSVGMLLGRLELFTVLVIFTPTFWRA